MIRCWKDRVCSDAGNTGVAVVFVTPALIVFAITLISAQQQWNARRDAYAIAAEAARVAAQPDPVSVRVGFAPGSSDRQIRPDPSGVAEAEQFILTAGGSDASRFTSGGIVQTEEGASVTVIVRVDYIYGVPGLPDELEVEAEAEVLEGVIDDGV